MRGDWPHLDILADKQALLGTDSRLKLIEAVLFDVRRRVEELNDTVAAAGERLDLVERNCTQQKQAGPSFSQLNAQGKRQFPAPPADDSDSLYEDVEFLRHALEDDRMKWEQEIKLLKRKLEGYEESNKRFTESQRVQQSVLDSCLQRIENCEDMRASIHKLTDAEVEIRRRLQEVKHNIDNCVAKQRPVCEDRDELIDSHPIDGPKPARGVDPLLAGHNANLLRDVAGASERLRNLELCMQGSTRDRQDQSTAHQTLVKDVRRMQINIATISRSVSKIAKDVLDMRASDLTSRSPTPRSVSSTKTPGGTPGQTLDGPNAQASSVVDIDQLVEKSPHVHTSPSAPSLSTRSPVIRSPYIRPPGNWLRPDCAHANEDLANGSSTSTWSMPPRNTDRENSSISSLGSPAQMVAARLAQNRFAMAQAALSADPRSANFGAKSSARSALNEPVPADRFSLRPQLSVRQRLAHPIR